MSSLQLPRFSKRLEFHGRAFRREELQELAGIPALLRLDFANAPLNDEEVAILCGLPNLEELWLEGTRVTDAVLPAIAQLPNLKWLILDGTAITGDGFGAFSKHTGLRTLWVSHTKVGDSAARFIAQIPKLRVLVAKGTQLTRAGVLALAANKNLEVNLGEPVSSANLQAFDEAQQTIARGNSKQPPACDEDVMAARAVLEQFFREISAWECAVAQAHRTNRDTADWRVDELADVFARLCTKKERKFGRPNALSYAIPPEFEGHTILEAEAAGPNKLCFYTRDSSRSRHRFFLVKKKGAWLVDRRETLRDEWERSFL